MRTRSVTLCVAVAVAVALLVGCGGDDGGDDAEAEDAATPNHGLDDEAVFVSAEITTDDGATVTWESTRTADQACTWVAVTVSNCLDVSAADADALNWSVGASSGYSAVVGLAPEATETVELDFGGQARTLPLDAAVDGTQAFGWAMAYADTDSIPATIRALDASGETIDSVEIDLVARN